MSLLPKPKPPRARPARPVNDDPTALINTSFRATDLHVRWAVSHAVDKLCASRVATDFLFSVEIALAEILNNIVEHGYRGSGEGDIKLNISLVDDRIRIETIDHGIEMPGLEAPHPTEPNLDVARNDLPEGNFGWYMIRELSEDLEYKRINKQNHLSMFIPH
jgi:serine/threonine-protein kinase RsbW